MNVEDFIKLTVQEKVKVLQDIYSDPERSEPLDEFNDSLNKYYVNVIARATSNKRLYGKMDSTSSVSYSIQKIKYRK